MHCDHGFRRLVFSVVGVLSGMICCRRRHYQTSSELDDGENHSIRNIYGSSILVESNTDFLALDHTLGMWFILLCLLGHHRVEDTCSRYYSSNLLVRVNVVRTRSRGCGSRMIESPLATAVLVDHRHHTHACHATNMSSR
jgi:hypothetical protein